MPKKKTTKKRSAGKKKPDHWIAKWRKARGLSQSELGKVIGVARNTVARWELETAPIPGYLHLALAELARRPEFIELEK